MEKSKFTMKTDDFTIMNWHDCKIYAIAFQESEFKLLFDLDYIYKWILDEDGRYKFLVAPVTLVFENVCDFNVDIEYNLDVTIEEIQRSNPSKPKNSDYIKKDTQWDWIIETRNGEISFKSVGYTQYTRKYPIYKKTQFLDFGERGGYSFDEQTFMK